MAREFTERTWHWWLRVAGIPVLLALVGAGVLLYVNRAPETEAKPDIVTISPAAGRVELTARSVGDSGPFGQDLHIDHAGVVTVRMEFVNQGGWDGPVMAALRLPDSLRVATANLRILNANNPSGVGLHDASVTPTSDGVDIEIGRYTPGSNALVLVPVVLGSPEDLECGENTFSIRADYSAGADGELTATTNEVLLTYTGLRPTC